jgi:hypothetical protein
MKIDSALIVGPPGPTGTTAEEQSLTVPKRHSHWLHTAAAAPAGLAGTGRMSLRVAQEHFHEKAALPLFREAATGLVILLQIRLAEAIELLDGTKASANLISSARYHHG